MTAPLPMLPGFSSLHEILQCLDVGEARLRGAVAPETARGVSSFFARSGVYIYILHMEYNIPPHQHIIYIYVFNYLFRFTHMFADVGYICRYETLFTNMAKRDAFCLL